jgi:hypothetical protein
MVQLIWATTLVKYILLEQMVEERGYTSIARLRILICL